MKRLIFLIWLLINSPLWANTKTVVIGDSTYFNYTHTTAIDSAQLILIRGTVKDTLSLMPITGSSHKICDWEGIFNQVDSAGNYNVWIEPYSSGAIADTILGDCLVELDSVLVDGSSLAATAGAISDATLAASAINKIAAYPNYLFKCVVSGSPTTQVFQVSYISPTMIFVDNQFNGLRLVSIYSQGGGAQGQVNNIADFASADSTFTIRPGMTTSVNSGDTVLVLPQRMAVEPVVLTNHAIATDGSGYVSVGDITSGAITAAAFHGEAADEIAESTYTFTSGTNRLAREEDSTAFQGAAAGLDSAKVAQVMQATFNDSALIDTGWVAQDPEAWTAADTAAYQGPGASLDTTKIKTMMNNNVWGSGYIWDYDLTGWDDSTAEEAGQFLSNIGIDNISHSIPTLHMKLGDYSGATGSNIEDDFDTLLTRVGGFDGHLCSLWVSNASGAITLGDVKMTSGATEYGRSINGDGWTVFSLGAGTWTGVASVVGNDQDTLPQTFSISADLTDSITMTAFTYGSPTDTGKVILYIYTDRILGDILAEATFKVIPKTNRKNWRTDGGKVVLPGTASAKTNSSGRAAIEVYQSFYVHPYRYKDGEYIVGSDSLKYDIEVSYPGLKTFKIFNYVTESDSNDWIGGP